jgi:hypothetical protein
MVLTRQIAEFQPFVNCWQTDGQLYSLSRQTYEWDCVIRSYHFIRIIDLECNFLAGKDHNCSGRLAITILLQLLCYQYNY